jgi:hypothetical protein
MRRSTILNLPLQLVFLGETHVRGKISEYKKLRMGERMLWISEY